MASYKVIQDIEAEDKLVGPLSLRQFIYAGVAAVLLYLSAVAVAKGGAFFLAVLLPPALFTGFLAFPWGRDQPTELWLLAKIRYMTKPKIRVWDQGGASELVTITAPKRAEKQYTNGLSEYEVRSRLNTLAKTIDSRGWAAKNVDPNTYKRTLQMVAPSSDRLVNPAGMPQEVSNVDVVPSDDILDEQNSHVSQQFDQMLTASTQARRQKLIDQLGQLQPSPAPIAAAPPAAPVQARQAQPIVNQPQNINTSAQKPSDNYWFLNEQANSPKIPTNDVVFAAPQVVQPGSVGLTAGAAVSTPTAEEIEIAKKLKEQQLEAQQNSNQLHLKTILPLSEQQARDKAKKEAEALKAKYSKPEPPEREVSALTRNLASNNDLNIATIARIANKQDEVVIKLH